MINTVMMDNRKHGKAIDLKIKSEGRKVFVHLVKFTTMTFYRDYDIPNCGSYIIVKDELVWSPSSDVWSQVTAYTLPGRHPPSCCLSNDSPTHRNW
ncbi:hypothetical protein C5167_034394 [Papaver somniferum]|uniref:Uncharacterized protein n=1 Tax=Papaver somniferum TaxID=3469 RepID=A0A4Y7KFS7_PAPSO|nr:hypothetical protein C5167_034394 [Papaver somniferum]